jgi:1-acyl-sn-glycerol-3-phosphate acyltransferase
MEAGAGSWATRPRAWLRREASALGPADLEERLERALAPMRAPPALGRDPFDYDGRFVADFLAPALWLYRRYFRVRVHGPERVPPGPVMLIANHSGQIPLDGLMIALAVLCECDPPRWVRAMADRWLPTLPFVWQLFSRTGQLVGNPENCRALLDRGEAVLVFPEGARGMCKPFRERYSLQPFGRGFAEIAAEAGVPVVPISVVGAEEQYISVGNLAGLGRRIGLPALPIVPQLAVPLIGWMPLPTRYHIHFGDPLRLADGDDAERVERAVAAQLREDLARRRSVFL